GADFEAGIDQLLEVLNTDLERVHLHTRLLARALEWETRDRDRSLLLRGAELKDAESWWANQTGHNPATTPAQGQLILASRRATIRRQRGFGIAGVTVAVAMAVLATVALIQRQNAITQHAFALSRQLAAQSQSINATNPVTARRLA